MSGLIWVAVAAVCAAVLMLVAPGLAVLAVVVALAVLVTIGVTQHTGRVNPPQSQQLQPSQALFQGALDFHG